jgi:hypothetical protein
MHLPPKMAMANASAGAPAAHSRYAKSCSFWSFCCRLLPSLLPCSSGLATLPWRVSVPRATVHYYIVSLVCPVETQLSHDSTQRPLKLLWKMRSKYSPLEGKTPARQFIKASQMTPIGPGENFIIVSLDAIFFCQKAELSIDTIMKIPKSEAALLPNKTYPIKDEPGYYLGALDVFHQLHCLVGLLSLVIWIDSPIVSIPEQCAACPS